MKNNCTLIVDGNWLFMSRLFINKHQFSIYNTNEDNIICEQSIKDIMSRSITNILTKLDGVVDNILFVYDGGSWRKQIYPQYKSNRVKSNDLNWDAIWNALNSFGDNIKQQNITYCCVKDLEGDDLVYFWTKKLNKEGVNCIIWSTDHDLQQLVCNNGETFTSWLNGSKEELVLHNSFNKEVSPIDFMMEIECVENRTLTKLKSLYKEHISYISPDDIIMEKIVCGDKGDNIKPIIQEKKGDKTYGISSKKWDSIKNSLQICNIKDFFNKKEEIANIVVQDKPYPIKEVIDTFDLNTKLVWLDKQMIPISLLKEANKINYSIYDINNIKNNYKVLVGDQEEESALKSLSQIDVPF